MLAYFFKLESKMHRVKCRLIRSREHKIYRYIIFDGSTLWTNFQLKLLVVSILLKLQPTLYFFNLKISRSMIYSIWNVSLPKLKLRKVTPLKLRNNVDVDGRSHLTWNETFLSQLSRAGKIFVEGAFNKHGSIFLV